MDNIYSTLFGALFADYNSCEKIGCDTVGEYIIDTCCTIDQGWETAVWKNNGDMIIVGRYPSKEHAKVGHIHWCAACALNPIKAWSVQTDSYKYF